jgi:hypothetical protein
LRFQQLLGPVIHPGVAGFEQATAAYETNDKFPFGHERLLNKHAWPRNPNLEVEPATGRLTPPVAFQTRLTRNDEEVIGEPATRPRGHRQMIILRFYQLHNKLISSGSTLFFHKENPALKFSSRNEKRVVSGANERTLRPLCSGLSVRRR